MKLLSKIRGGLRVAVPVTALLVGLLACGLLLHRSLHRRDPGERKDVVALVVPDQMNANDRVHVEAWRDAAIEQGVPLQVVTSSEFVRDGIKDASKFIGVILPDTIHRRMTNAMVDTMHQFVRSGGAMMLVYDAGAQSETGLYAKGKSRFSDLAGVDYLMYDKLGDKTASSLGVWGSAQDMLALGIPPGRWIERDGRAVLSGYGKDVLRYPSQHSSGQYRGRVMMRSEDGDVIAGESQFGSGKVLFVNMPVGYLKLRTDGVLLHGFLQYFAGHMLDLPQLSAAPDGVGGLVLNWHCDAAICVEPLRKLIDAGVFRHGPFSVHVTAGPDQRMPGDNLGIDLDHNEPFKDTLRALERQGHRLGSHGGWIHDWFGGHLAEDNQAAMEPYLQRNADAIQAVIGHPQTEYSAPTGNQPVWVTHWLNQRHVKGYYFVGDVGMAPTRAYRDNFPESNIWAFPVQTYGHIATIEEAYTEGVSEQVIADWLRSLVDFTASSGEVRLIYFHPPGAVRYLGAIQSLMQAASDEEAAGRFRWQTISDMADFLERRSRTTWTLDIRGHTTTLHARNDDSVAELTWRFPTRRYALPRIASGTGHIALRHGAWEVIAEKGTDITISADLLKREAF